MLVTWYHKNNENDSLTSFLHNNFKYHTLTEQDKQQGGSLWSLSLAYWRYF
ncbi:hypothetical protein EMIT074MI3_10137 [Bacillus licheniformis]